MEVPTIRPQTNRAMLARRIECCSGSLQRLDGGRRRQVMHTADAEDRHRRMDRRKEVLADVPLRSRCFEIETELLCRAAARRWKIISVPVRTIYAEDHASYIRPVRDAFRFISVILRHALGRS